MSGKHGELTCQELVELVTDYLELRLPAPERARFDEHVTTCRGCQAHLEQMRQTLRVAGALREEAVAPAAREALLAAFRGWKRGV
ncbi:MAG: zf-HC2 domain-containing protein [Deltaproteobacteria bacterium]|nr:zf-HC2 domain-containing protein [Deltaproteobacteria bacterium]